MIIVNRRYASTMMNHASSRSHTLFRFYVQSMQADSSNKDNIFMESILNFVDLAGSEKLEVHGDSATISRHKLIGAENSARGSLQRQRTKESQHINKSLFFLTQVISMKAKGNA